MIKKLRILTLSAILGGVLGYLIAWAHIIGWFSTSWQLIPPPPEKPVELVQSNGSQLWIASESGAYFFNSSTLYCDSDCWLEIESVPNQIEPEFVYIEISKEACASPLPLLSVKSRLEECHKEMWVDSTYVYALRNNGEIFAWQSDIYGEWIILELIQCTCGGSLIISLLALLTMGVAKSTQIYQREQDNNLDKKEK